MVLWRQTNIFYLIMTLHLLLNIMGPKRRCSIKSYALKSRYLGLTVQEKRKASNYRRWIRQLIIIQAVDGTGAEAAELEEVTEILILMYVKLTRERRIPRIPIPRQNRTIESFSDIEISDCFRFRNRLQLHQLKSLLKIPDNFNLPYRHSCTGEELLLVGLYRLSSTKDLIDLEITFGRDYTWISRVFDMFVIWIEDRHSWHGHSSISWPNIHDL